jgi:hypothetical protein
MVLYSETIVSLHFQHLQVYHCAYKGLLSVRASLYRKLDSGLMSMIKSSPDFEGIPDISQSNTMIVASGHRLITRPERSSQNPICFWQQEVVINSSGSFKLLLPGYPGLWDPELTLKIELIFKPDHLVA